MTGGAGAHATADRGDAVIELAQILHHLQSGPRFDFVLDSVAIHDSQERHAVPYPLFELRIVCGESARDLVVCRFAPRAARGALASLTPTAAVREPSSQTRP